MAEIISEGVAKVLCTFGVGAAGGLAVALIANRLRASTEAALKRRRFRSQIELLRGRIESRSEDELAITHEFREIPKLESEAVQVRHFIQRRLRRRFDSLCAAYKAVSFDPYSGTDQKRTGEAQAKNEKSKRELGAILQDISNCAWWNV